MATLTAAPLSGVSGSASSTPKNPKTPPADAYTARHLSVLEGLDAVRKRPGMYVGSTDGRGLIQVVSSIGA